MITAHFAARRGKSNTGQSLVELLLVIGLMGVFLPALLTGLLVSRDGKAQQTQRLQAVTLLKEGEEVVRSVREKGWNSFSINGTYHPAASGSAWSLVPGEETIHGFTRKIVISDVFRDANGIASDSGTIDPSTKKAITTVSWTSPIAASVQATTFLTRYLNNTSFTQTTQADFNAGTKNGVAITNTNGGEVVLGAGGSGDWCNPNNSIITQLDLPKNGVANALSAYEGNAIVGTGENSSGVSLANISINNASPPIASVSATFDGYKTNDVFLDANYAYIATDDNQKEVVIISLANNQEVGYFNVPGSTDATSVYVSGNKGYVTAGFYLYIFDLSSKTGSRPQLGSFFFLGNATSVIVKENYAYVSLSSSPIEMQIIDISNPQSLSNSGWADVNGTDGKRIFVNQTGTRAYLATGVDPSRPEFFIVDVTQKTGSRPTIGSYNANGMDPANLSVVPGNKALLVGTNAEEYQVIDITSETNPARCGGMNIDTGIKSVVGVLEADGDAYSYIVTGDSNSEFKIIEGGPGGQFATNGSLESTTFDATTPVAFNRFFATVSKPPLTDITFQVAGADANPGTGNCTGTTFSFVGPDGTSGTYFATNSAIPTSVSGSYKNPARCFRYKAFLSTTDQTQSPVFYDMTVNYSP